MTAVFDAWSAYYDAFYGSKDYATEVAYVDGLITQHAPGAASILDLGCGTGSHALEFALRGFTVHGVDTSESMLAIARRKQAAATPSIREAVSFSHGDVRQYRSNDTVDVVTSLFHVMSYQTTDHDVMATFDTAAAALTPGGLLVFDVWFGPAVEAIKPEERTRTVSIGTRMVSRLATPLWHPADRTVEVVFDVAVQDREQGVDSSFVERHLMRYFFLPELRAMLDAAGFDELACHGWLGTSAPTSDDWSVCIVARRKG